jgi:type IV secretory pathway protease TraF
MSRRKDACILPLVTWRYSSDMNMLQRGYQPNHASMPQGVRLIPILRDCVNSHKLFVNGQPYASTTKNLNVGS